MAAINFPFDKVPDELLLKIFDYLSFEQRKEVSLVNKRFNCLLQDNRYTKNAVLVLEHCWISKKYPPWTFIETSSKKFTQIVIGESLAFDHSINAEEFWQHIGKEVEKITFISSENLELQQNFMKSFPRLKSVEFYDWIQFQFLFQIPESVEHIHVNDFISFPFRHIKELQAMKHHVKSFVSKGWDLQEDCFNINDLQIVHQRTFGGWFRIKLLNINLLELSTLNYSHFAELKHISFVLQGADTPSKAVETLSKFVNLETIRLSFENESNCFFVHETVALHKVKTVRLDTSDWRLTNTKPPQEFCETCLEYLISSCPSLCGWVLNAKILNIEKLLNSTLRPLRKLTLKNQDRAALTLNFPSLEKLKIRENKRISLNFSVKLLKLWKIDISDAVGVNFKEMTEFCPSVVEFCWHKKYSVRMMQVIEQNWKYLKNFELGPKNSMESPSNWRMVGDCSNGILREIKGNFRCLRYITVFSYDSIQDFHVNLFRKIPTLRFSRFYSELCPGLALKLSYQKFCEFEQDTSDYRLLQFEKWIDELRS